MKDRAWWIVHNLVAHPFFAFFPRAKWAERFHEWTARGKYFAAALLLLLALPAAAQEPGVPKPADNGQGDVRLADYLYAAAWCPLHSSGDDPGFGCDAGLAVDLYSRPIGERYGAGLVALVGAETVGAGVAWCRRGSRLCAGVGVAAVRDDFGIDLDSATAVVGATFSLGGLRE